MEDRLVLQQQQFEVIIEELKGKAPKGREEKLHHQRGTAAPPHPDHLRPETRRS